MRVLTTPCTFAGIVKGTAGFAELSRGFFREQGASIYIMDGTEKTCVADCIIVCAAYAGACVVKSKVTAALYGDKKEELPLYTAIDYARAQVCQATVWSGCVNAY